MKSLAALCFAALALAGCGGKDDAAAPAAPVKAVAPPAGQDWTQTVGKTAEAGRVRLAAMPHLWRAGA